MKRLYRFLTALVLALAPAAPLRAGWYCPDGTPCLPDGHGYRCAGGHCAVRTCCREAEPARCRHGAWPVRESRPSPAVEQPARCRFAAQAPPVLVAVRSDAATRAAAAVPALPPEPLPATPSLRVRSAPIFSSSGERPPPFLSDAPARAPPSP